MAHAAIPVHQRRAPVPVPSAAPNEVHPFVVVGSGPVGLAFALDMARKGHQVLLLTAFDFIAAGSKGICYSKQSLDILDRLGVGDRVVDKGVVWNVGKVFWKDRPDPVYEFDMLPVKDQKNPGFVNIQQYYVEEFLVDALERRDNVEIRWGHRVEDVAVEGNRATLDVSSPGGDYSLDAGYVVACDGCKSHIRACLGLGFQGRIFEDNFLIADIRIKESRPSERLFWFDPPFHKGGTALYHKQPDNVWRLDFQLGWDIDREKAVQPENVDPLVRGMLGDDVRYEKEWYSVYTFQCRRMERFVHGPVIFAGDSAHLVSPFGARGANSGFSDAENLAWKLDLVLRGMAPEGLLESYDYERTMGADENVLNSTRSTEFITPKNHMSHVFRDAVLELARDHAFARPFVNSGRLSTPTPYHDSPLSTADADEWEAGPAPGFACIDAPIDPGNGEPWLLKRLGDGFKLLVFGEQVPETDLEILRLPAEGLAAERYGALDGGTYLIRPDQVVAARWKSATAEKITKAHRKAIAHGG